LRNSTHQRLAALEAIADRIIDERMHALNPHYKRIVGPEVLEQATALVEQASRGELGDEEYMQRYESLFAPYAAQLEADPQIQAIWRTLGRALSYREMIERMQLRKRTR